MLLSFDIILIVSKLLTARQTRKERNMKRAILYTLNFIIFMAMLTFIALLDSDNYMPYMIGFLLCVAWFTLFCYTNNYFYHNDRQAVWNGIQRGSSPLTVFSYLIFRRGYFRPDVCFPCLQGTVELFYSSHFFILEYKI